MTTAIANSSDGTGIKSRSYTIQPWIVCFAASLFFFYEFLQVNMFNAIGPALMSTLHMSAPQLGRLSACYMYANVIFMFPAGLLLDRFSTRRIILLAMISCVLCTFLFSLSHSIWQLNACRFVTGIGGAFCLISCVRLASRWFPPKRMALIIGLVVTLAMIGAMIAQTPFTLMTDHFGWRETLQMDAAMGLMMLVVIAIFVQDFPTTNIHAKQSHALQVIHFWQSLKRTLANIQNWLAGIFASLINLPIFLLGATWGSLYLTQMRHLSREEASMVTSMIFFGMIIGSPMLGWLSDTIGMRKLPMIIGAIASLITIMLIIYLPHLNFSELLLLFFILGFVVASQILAYPLVAESNSSKLTATSEGFASIIIMAGGFMIPLFPYLLEMHWNHQVINHIPVYSVNNYHLALLIMPIAFVIALFASFLLKETYCRSYDETQRQTALSLSKSVEDSL